MARKTEENRKALRETIIDIAEGWINTGGIERIKARPLAKEAGCAVGAIYNVFDDLRDIVIEVNGRTFHRLGQQVQTAIDGRALTPTETLVEMSLAYMRFAAENTPAWQTLFDLQLTEDDPVPQWYLDELGQLFRMIAAPLARIFPDKTQDELDLLTRALFSSVHGMVTLGLERRISGVPQSKLKLMIETILRAVTEKS